MGIVTADNRNSNRMCTWQRPCASPGEHPVWRETRPGLIVHERVCNEHLPHAIERYAYRTDTPPIPPPPDVD